MKTISGWRKLRQLCNEWGKFYHVRIRAFTEHQLGLAMFSTFSCFISGHGDDACMAMNAAAPAAHAQLPSEAQFLFLMLLVVGDLLTGMLLPVPLPKQALPAAGSM